MRWRVDTRSSKQGFVGGCRSAVEVVALLLLLLLQLSQAQSVPPLTACANATPQNLNQPHYHENPPTDTGVGFMAAPVQSFLHTVQSNPFPQDLILQVIQRYDRLWSNEDIIKDVLIYEVGFLVCIAIGVLYIVLMPIVGFFLACCRCHDKCGGKMYQEQTSSTHCDRRIFYWSMFVTTVIILAGNICMFRSNENLRMSVDQSPVEIRNTVDNINTFLVTVPQQIDFVVNESHKTVDEVTGNFNDIGRQLGTAIQRRFSGTLDPALDSVRLLHQETILISNTLKTMASLMEALQSSMMILQDNVTAVRNRINQTLSKPNCLGCDYLISQLERLEVEPTISILDFEEFQFVVEEVVNTNLNVRVREVEDYFRSIPQTVTDDTKDIVQSSIQMLGDIKTQISRVRGDIPLSSLTKNVSQYVEIAQREINNVLPHAQRAERIRWAVCVALCSMVFLVVVCYILGLVLGPPGLSPKADPTKRSSASNCGGIFLMMGAGFSFLFAWLFMIAVLILFVLGGNVYTLLCRPWSNGQLLEFLDTPGLFPGLDLGPNLGLKTNLTFSGIYRDCEKNNSLWTTLHLQELIDLEELLNVSKYTEEIEKDFENTVISLASLVLLDGDVQALLSHVAAMATDFDSTPVIGFNLVCDDRGSCTEYSHFISSDNANFSSDALNTTANELDSLAAAQADVSIQEELQSQANDLRQIEERIQIIVDPQQQLLNTTIIAFESIREKVIETVDEVLSSMEVAQDFLDTSTTEIVETESRRFLDCQLDYFTSYADWAVRTLTQQVGRCGSMAGAVDSVEIVVCAHIVESLNAFWFSLGWCMIFFLPGIIFSIKLAKYYRRMKKSEVDLENGPLPPSTVMPPLHKQMKRIPPEQQRPTQKDGTRGQKQKRKQKKKQLKKKRKRRQANKRKHPANPNN